MRGKILSIIILVFVCLIIFVSAAMTPNLSQSTDELEFYDVTLQISKGWNFISFPAGLDFKLDGSSFNDGELKYGYLYSVLDKT